MSNEEIDNLIKFLAENPTAGDEIPGTGGCRKIRWAKPGRGKRGGYRTITFYSGLQMPVFLVTVFAKGEKSNLTKSERNALSDLTKAIVAEYQRKVAVMAKKGV